MVWLFDRVEGKKGLISPTSLDKAKEYQKFEKKVLNG